jgi:hypothetical protein
MVLLAALGVVEDFCGEICFTAVAGVKTNALAVVAYGGGLLDVGCKKSDKSR